MSKMSELDFQIRDLLDEGISPEKVATMLACPLEMVYDIISEDEADQYEEDLFLFDEYDDDHGVDTSMVNSYE